MGNRLPTLTAEQLDDYQDATFFTRKDILRAQKRYRQLDPDRIPREMTGDEPHSISLPLKVMETLPEIQENPFRRRICQVFSSSGTGDMTFEDFLDMLNVMSEAAPRDIKVHFAFRIFDYNEDGYLDASDLSNASNDLTCTGLSNEEIETVIDKVLEESDIDDDGKLSFIEFQHIIERAPDFVTNFHIRI